MPNYQACLALNDCDLCSAAKHCGWCEITNRCLPVNPAPNTPEGMKSELCPNSCINGWIFDQNSCRGTVKGGYMSNIAPEFTGVIDPEMAAAKLNVKTTLHTQAVVKTPVLLGHEVKSHEVTVKDPISG